jgi:hypothetical protein
LSNKCTTRKQFFCTAFVCIPKQSFCEERKKASLFREKPLSKKDILIAHITKQLLCLSLFRRRRSKCISTISCDLSYLINYLLRGPLNAFILPVLIIPAAKRILAREGYALPSPFSLTDVHGFDIIVFDYKRRDFDH